MIAAVLLTLAVERLPSTPELGKAAGHCRANESGPAFLVEVIGLKDRTGRVKLELYPANDTDFLADDNVLIAAGKPFARVEADVRRDGPTTLCIRAPRPGSYALSLLHDRDLDRRFSLSADGIGFSRNPALHLSRPRAASATVAVGTAPVTLPIVLNYRKGLLSFGPVER